MNGARLGLASNGASTYLKRDGTSATGPQALLHVAPTVSGSKGSGDLSVGSEKIVVRDNSGNTNDHSAFPGLALTSGGRLLAAWREAPGHSATTGSSRGIIYVSTSNDLGRTWSSPSEAVDLGDWDARDPSLQELEDGTIVMSFFGHNGGLLSTPYVAKSTDGGSTWGTPIEIVNDFTADLARLCAPVVELSDGTLCQPFYGKNTGDTFWTSAVIFSSNQGVTWSGQTVVADGEAASVDYVEPFIGPLDGGDYLCLIRENTNFEVHATTSSDECATWAATSKQFDGYGRPAFIQVSSGAIAVIYRSALTGDNRPSIRVSWDDASTWTDESFFGADDDQYVYAQLVELSAGLVAVCYGLEPTAGAATINLRFLLDGHGTSPVGDRSYALNETASGLVPVSGKYTQVGLGSVSTGYNMIGNLLYAWRVDLAEDCVLDRVALGVSGAGDGTSEILLGIADFNGGDPSAADVLAIFGDTHGTGSIDGTSATDQEITGVGLALSAGRYWVLALANGHSATTPTVDGVSAAGPAGPTPNLGQGGTVLVKSSESAGIDDPLPSFTSVTATHPQVTFRFE